MRARGLLAATQSVAARLLSDLQSRQAVGITAVTHVPRDWESVVPDPVERPTAGASYVQITPSPGERGKFLIQMSEPKCWFVYLVPSCHWVVTAAALYPLQRCVRQDASVQFQGDQPIADCRGRPCCDRERPQPVVTGESIAGQFGLASELLPA
jgi:hypothetical protein